MLRLIFLAAFMQCAISQQYKTAPGVPPQNYQQQNYQQPPPPPPPQQQQQQQQPIQQQQYQPPPPQYQQAPPPQQFQQPPPQQQAHHGGHGGHDPQLLNPTNIAQEREHIQEHLDVPIDTSKMSEQELMFHYFKMHDADNNNKLDGCELIKSLIHWHGGKEENRIVYNDDQLEQLTETALKHTDLNYDGYIDFVEYRINDIRARQAKRTQNAQNEENAQNAQNEQSAQNAQNTQNDPRK